MSRKFEIFNKRTELKPLRRTIEYSEGVAELVTPITESASQILGYFRFPKEAGIPGDTETGLVLRFANLKDEVKTDAPG